jgi:hypothetical protein
MGRNNTWQACLDRMETLPGLLTAKRLSVDLGISMTKARNLITFAQEGRVLRRVSWGLYQWVPAAERQTACA